MYAAPTPPKAFAQILAARPMQGQDCRQRIISNLDWHCSIMRVVRPVLARCQRDSRRSHRRFVNGARTGSGSVHVQAPHQRDGWRAGDGGAVSVVVCDTPLMGYALPTCHAALGWTASDPCGGSPWRGLPARVQASSLPRSGASPAGAQAQTLYNQKSTRRYRMHA
ncbi:MAG: hypothetical protein KatS3mg056_2601 [Chloroflexus sp.]|nr:MAG: hypothetical protein KatS3mg056_2601 [Chloroflexus sp.]